MLLSLAALLAQLRSDLDDTATPYLWSDDELTQWIFDSESMLVRLTGGIADSTSDMTRISIIAGTEWYAVDPRIMKIRKAIRKDTGRPIDVVNPETAWDRGVRYDGATASLQLLIQGLEDGKLRAYPVPATAVDIELQVLRLPLTTGQAITPTSALEVPAQHHLHLLAWAKSRAYLKQDAETIDKTKAAEFEAEFRNYCKEVQGELSRQRRTTGTTTYGGI